MRTVKYTKEEREKTCNLLSMRASDRANCISALYEESLSELGRPGELAFLAFMASEEEFDDDDAQWARHYAEAEMMLRCGWEPA